MERKRETVVEGISSFWLLLESKSSWFYGREFQLTQEAVSSIYQRQGGKCYYTGGGIPLPSSAATGLDRPGSVAIVCLDSSGPVTESNSVLTTRKTRSIRSMFNTEEEFVDFCRNVSTD